MPQRFLRPGLRTSPRWNSVSHEAARLYIALITQVDDYGRYDGRNSVLWSDAFAVWNEQNPSKEISAEVNKSLTKELEDAKLVVFYEVDGRRYCAINQWCERARGASKWPEPPAEKQQMLAYCEQPAGIRSGTLETAANGCEILPPQPAPLASASASATSSVDRDVEKQCHAIYDAYPRKVGKPEALKAIKKALLKTPFDELLRMTKEYALARTGEETTFTPHPSTFFHQERYNDDKTTWNPSRAKNGIGSGNGGARPTPADQRNSFIHGAYNGDNEVALAMRGALANGHPAYAEAERRGKLPEKFRSKITATNSVAAQVDRLGNNTR